ncbi:MAG: hypothetical protein JZU47_07040 [Prolixibacteraceae bacterium]|nr:hypothetical protein [Prolixibacteraceae bacterium]
MDENYKQFVDKLNSYIRKFYFYRLLRGIILFILLLLVYYSCISALEYFNYFDPKIKFILLVFTFLITILISFYFLIIPGIKLLGIGKRLNYYDVSSQLQKTYPEIQDRLINIVELANEQVSNYSSDLQKASIDQKIDELKIFNFSDAIRYKDLKVVVFVLLGVLLLFLAMFISIPDFFTESSVRLIHFQQKFEKPAPYTFELLNNNLEIVTGESVELKLKCKGKEIPEVMFVDISGNRFLMSKETDVFVYKIENINSSVSVYFTDKKYVSKIYKVTVLNKPFISSFSVEIIPPSYTNIGSEILQNIGDMKVVAGTTVKWVFNTVDTDSLFLFLNDSSKVIAKRNENSFELNDVILSDFDYSVFVKNAKLTNENTLVYKIQTIADLYPEIKAVQVRDSMDFKTFHFKGNVVDDFGFSQLDFNISFEGKDSVFHIPFTPFFLNQDFYYSFNFESVRSLGKSFKYYFSVSDNDIINHFKRSISETFTFTFPDYQEILTKENTDFNSIDELFKKSSKLTEEIQNEFENFKMKQINSEVSEWEKFQTVKDIMSKKNELENILEQISKQNKDANNFMNSFSEEKQDILKKQQEIENLLNEVFSDDLKKLFEEFNDLAKQFDLKKFDQLSKQMDSKIEDLSKQLEKNMQLLKKMKVEQKVERILEELKKINNSEKLQLEKLAKNPDLKQINTIEKENLLLLKSIEKDYSETLEFNKTLAKPMNLFNFDREFLEITSNYTKVISELEKGNKRKSSSAIEINIKSLDQLIFAIDQMLNKDKKKENEANIEDLKQILDNLILVSFDQEKILNKLLDVDFNNPLINEIKVKQKNIASQVVFIKDSLYALSKRTPEISSIINKEVLALEQNMASTFDFLESGNIGGSRMYQQYTITAANNLALFLSEALENIKKQQNNKGEGEEDCDKPGSKGSKPGMKKLKDSQGSIKDQLQKMIDQMKKGDMGKMSKSIGQTLAQQEIMQQLIREMLNGNNVGSKAGAQLKAVDQLLEQTRKDLINRNITSELVNRQNLILSKLLEAEKSEIERDFEEKRESKTAIDIKKGNPDGYFEYNNALKHENEIIKRNNFKLRSFYDQKYNQFLNKIKD